MTTLKRCTKCGDLHPTTAFNRDANRADGLYLYCRPCTRKAANAAHSKNTKSRNAKAIAYKKANPEQVMLFAARKRAKDGGYPCTITAADIVIPPVCPVLGIPLVRGSGRPTDNSPSLDKISPHLGYVPGNVAVVSHRANRIKSNATAQELQRVAAWAAEQERRVATSATP